MRTQNRDFVNGELEKIFKTRTTAEWMKRFAEYDVPAAPVQDLYQALRHDPQIAHNKTVIVQDHPTAGKVEVQALPVNFHGTPAQYRRASPRFGEHSVEVLQEFGFKQDEIDSLLASKAVGGLEA